MTDAGVIALGAGWDLTCCGQVTDAGIRALGAGFVIDT